jgi:hypothetical protein
VPRPARAAIGLRRFPQSGLFKPASLLAAVDSRPRQGIGCAQGATRSASRRRRAGFSGADAVAAAISATEAAPADLRRRLSSRFLRLELNGAGRPRDEQGALSGLPRPAAATKALVR